MNTHSDPEELVSKKDTMENGFYWARNTNKSKWYNVIVEVHGKPPFQRVRAWRIVDHTFIDDVKDTDSLLIGPKIIMPKVPQDEIDSKV